jgi:hypothetical protein
MHTRTRVAKDATPSSAAVDELKHDPKVTADSTPLKETVNNVAASNANKAVPSHTPLMKADKKVATSVSTPSYPPEHSKKYSKDHSTRTYWAALPLVDIVNAVGGDLLVTRLGGILWREADKLIMDRTFWSLSFFFSPFRTPASSSHSMCVCAQDRRQ